MKRNTGLLLVALLAALTLLVSGCGEKQQTPDGAPDEPLMQEKAAGWFPEPWGGLRAERENGEYDLRQRRDAAL